MSVFLIVFCYLENAFAALMLEILIVFYYSENATAVLKSYMGAGNSKIMTTVYKYVTGMSTSYITMADDGCIPMAYEAAGQNADGG